MPTETDPSGSIALREDPSPRVAPNAGEPSGLLKGAAQGVFTVGPGGLIMASLMGGPNMHDLIAAFIAFIARGAEAVIFLAGFSAALCLGSVGLGLVGVYAWRCLRWPYRALRGRHHG